jgi:hypothetical protein
MLWKLPAADRPVSPGRHWIDIAALAILSIVALGATARFTLAPRSPELGVAVIFAPWTTPEQTLARTVEAGAHFVRFGGPSFIAVAIPDGPDYVAHVRAAGAWLIVDPKIVTACLSVVGAVSKP